MRYLKGTSEVGLVYGPNAENTGVVGFVDSDFAGDLDSRKSQTGYVFKMNNNTVSWKANLQSIVALSTTEAEYIACTEAVKEALWMKGITRELGIQHETVEIFCDSQSALHLSKNQVFHERTKHIDVRFHFIRNTISDGKVKLLKVHTKDNPSDMLTKALPRDKFQHLTVNCHKNWFSIVNKKERDHSYWIQIQQFSIFGNILSCKIATDDVSGQSKGYGFVQFDSKEAAQSAIEKLNGMLLNDKQVFVGPFIRKENRKLGAEQNVDKNKGMNLYVKNLDDSVTDEKLKELFFEFGTITSCKVMRKPNGVSMGFGFVALSTVEEASRALVEMNGKMVVSKPLYVALAQRKEDRRARLQAQFSQMRPPTMVPPVNPCMPMIPPQLGFGYQQQLLPGVRPNFYMPIVQPHPSFVLPQMLPRGRGFHRFPPGRNMPGRSFH
ncbi:polyadenylate-binding protein 2-like [Cannabis sativa]|uniref:polyadenylate-binding protein 2-like n=1 Tax=Cannabis sativa TaxID=3483 RepID=UPI0029C9F02D|nr:polyadenylate-binding protein 2-like [Cannabis sativa]